MLRTFCISRPLGLAANSGRTSTALRTPLVRRWFSKSSPPAVKTSTVDWKPVKSRPMQRNGKTARGVIMSLLVLMPLISFGLGTWQVYRLKWKVKLIAECEDRLSLPPLPLPSVVNPDVVHNFEYRRVLVRGKFRHDQEMHVGPRIRNGENGYDIVTPLERNDGSKVLVYRGWIAKSKLDQSKRSLKDLSLPEGELEIQCLIRNNPQKNMFTPDGHPEIGDYHFMDIETMAKATGSQPVYLQAVSEVPAAASRDSKGRAQAKVIEEDDGYLPAQFAAAGVPLPKEPRVELRNNHFQYILTWYGVCICSLIMLGMLLKTRNQTAQSEFKNKIRHAQRHM